MIMARSSGCTSKSTGRTASETTLASFGSFAAIEARSPQPSEEASSATVPPDSSDALIKCFDVTLMRSSDPGVPSFRTESEKVTLHSGQIPAHLHSCSVLKLLALAEVKG